MATARLSLVLSESNVSTANNTSTVTANLYYYGNGVSNNTEGSSKGTITIDGSSYSFKHSFTKSTSAQWLGSASKTVTHNSDGSKTVSASASFFTNVSLGTMTTSASLPLTTIARTSDLSISKTSIPADGSTTMTATATKKTSSFTDTIVVKLGSYSKTVTSGTAFSIPLEWNNAISGTSATATVTVTTKNGSTTVGTNTKNLTITVPDSVKPTISKVDISEANSVIATAFPNTYLKNLSKLTVDISAEGAYSSTISKYSTTFNSKTYTGSNFTSNIFSNSGDYNLSTTVTDSRNRTATYTKTVSIVDYTKPVISDIDILRCDSDGTLNISGTSSKIVITGTVDSVNSLNDKNISISVRKLSDTEYTTNNFEASAYSFTDSYIINNIEPLTGYEYIITLSDKLNTVSKTIKTGIPTLSRYAGGGGVTLFDNASEDGFIVERGKPSHFTGDFLFEDTELENLYNQYKLPDTVNVALNNLNIIKGCAAAVIKNDTITTEFVDITGETLTIHNVICGSLLAITLHGEYVSEEYNINILGSNSGVTFYYSVPYKEDISPTDIPTISFS